MIFLKDGVEVLDEKPQGDLEREKKQLIEELNEGEISLIEGEKEEPKKDNES